MALRAYGACILSLMGGVQWGILLPRDKGHAPPPHSYMHPPGMLSRRP
jgi:hypothetical protein